MSYYIIIYWKMYMLEATQPIQRCVVQGVLNSNGSVIFFLPRLIIFNLEHPNKAWKRIEINRQPFMNEVYAIGFWFDT